MWNAESTNRAINNKLAVQCAENQLFTTWLNLHLGKINTAISTVSIKAKTPQNYSKMGKDALKTAGRIV